MSNEIISTRKVKYHNDMATVSFTRFTPTDRKCFMALCYECKGKGVEEHLVYLDELREISGFGSKDNKRFLSYIKELTGKLHGIYYRQEKEDGGFKSFSLFETFETTDMTSERPALKVGVSKNFAYILNSDAETPEGILPLLSGGYTSFELDQFTSLKSTYSMEAFRQLKRFKFTGLWVVSLAEFNRLMDSPQSYRLPDIRRRVLGPIKEELASCFEDLKIEEIKGRGENGRKTTTALKFTFKPQTEKAIWFEDETKTAISEKCPCCGEPLYLIEKKNGDIFYGHKDGWKVNAKCRKTFGSLDEINGENGNAVDASKDSSGKKAEKTGFKCSECGRPLYSLYNEKGEMFYGHIDGWKKDALCRKTYGSVAEIKGLSETPSREDFYTLVERGEADRDSGQSVFDTIKTVIDNISTAE